MDRNAPQRSGRCGDTDHRSAQPRWRGEEAALSRRKVPLEHSAAPRTRFHFFWGCSAAPRTRFHFFFGCSAAPRTRFHIFLGYSAAPRTRFHFFWGSCAAPRTRFHFFFGCSAAPRTRFHFLGGCGAAPDPFSLVWRARGVTPDPFSLFFGCGAALERVWAAEGSARYGQETRAGYAALLRSPRAGNHHRLRTART
jgi:hypothetical protein